MVAGASEILVIADGTANPDWVALDLFSQAEHDEMAQAILLYARRGADRPRRAKRAAHCIGEMPRAADHRRSRSRDAVR